MKLLFFILSFILTNHALAQDHSYRVFTDAGDWFVVGKKTGSQVSVIYDGEYREEAYQSILIDQGVDFGDELEREFASGTYTPKLSDWKQKD